MADYSRLKAAYLFDADIGTGSFDENVLPGTVLQFVNALEKADKDFELVYMPGSNHVSGYAPNHILRRSEDFLIRHLLGSAPPR